MPGKKYVCCPQCGKRIYDGEMAVMRHGFIGYFCNERCLTLYHYYTRTVIVNDQTLEEDEYEWEGEES